MTFYYGRETKRRSIINTSISRDNQALSEELKWNGDPEALRYYTCSLLINLEESNRWLEKRVKSLKDKIESLEAAGKRQ